MTLDLHLEGGPLAGRVGAKTGTMKQVCVQRFVRQVVWALGAGKTWSICYPSMWAEKEQVVAGGCVNVLSQCGLLQRSYILSLVYILVTRKPLTGTEGLKAEPRR